MPEIFFTSDTHFGHNKSFLFAPRAFSDVRDMNAEIVKKWNSVIDSNDIVYHLGDTYLSGQENAELFAQLNGRIRLIRGNHDTDFKVQYLLQCGYIESARYGDMVTYKHRRFFLSHYPTICTNIEPTPENYERGAKNRLICLYGHTHQKSNFFQLHGEDIPFMYHVGLDSHGLCPVHIETVIADINAAVVRARMRIGSPELAR